jgi:hypothetical protein
VVEDCPFVHLPIHLIFLYSQQSHILCHIVKHHHCLVQRSGHHTRYRQSLTNAPNRNNIVLMMTQTQTGLCSCLLILHSKSTHEALMGQQTQFRAMSRSITGHNELRDYSMDVMASSGLCVMKSPYLGYHLAGTKKVQQDFLVRVHMYIGMILSRADTG